MRVNHGRQYEDEEFVACLQEQHERWLPKRVRAELFKIPDLRFFGTTIENAQMA